MAFSTKYRHSTEEDQVVTIIGLGLITLVLVLSGGYWIYSFLQQRETEAAQSALYRVYQRNTVADPAATQLPPAMQEAQRVREKLLAHPAVTPAPGFMRPGVQSTGNAIVDAIDQAQAREKLREQGRGSAGI